MKTTVATAAAAAAKSEAALAPTYDQVCMWL
jgi:hypothetical protein